MTRFTGGQVELECRRCGRISWRVGSYDLLCPVCKGFVKEL